MKKYVIIAGVNGAGKSTLYQTNDGLQTGHGIPESDIEKRYGETFKQLNCILKECNLVAFYDNTESFRRFAICKNGKLIRISRKVPNWFSNVQIDK